MTQNELTGFFEDFMAKESLFANKRALQTSYTPKHLPHREEQIKQAANILAPILKLEKPSNLFIYGKTGTGKTLVTNHIISEIIHLSNQKKKPIRAVYLNCKLKKTADTEYRLIAQLARELGREIPPTGLPTDEVYKIFLSALEKETKFLILVLDEIDQLVKKIGDGVLYNLTRANEELENAQITLIGISNDLLFVDSIDPRVKSSLSEEDLVFPPYNALQLQDILRGRAKEAFKDGAIGAGVIEKCAAYAAKEHGDARRALDLLRVAGELAERGGETTVLISHIDRAEEKIEKDNVMEVVTSQPKQFQATLYAISLLCAEDKKTSTGELYESYKKICLRAGLRPLTQRRVSDIIAEFDMLGIITAETISKGRYGKTREISLSIPRISITNIKKALEEGLELT